MNLSTRSFRPSNGTERSQSLLLTQLRFTNYALDVGLGSAALILNLLLIMAISLRKESRRKHIFLGLISFADFLNGFAFLFGGFYSISTLEYQQEIQDSYYEDWHHGAAVVSIVVALKTLAAHLAAAWAVAGNAEKLIAICIPLKYHKRWTSNCRLTIILIGLTYANVVTVVRVLKQSLYDINIAFFSNSLAALFFLLAYSLNICAYKRAKRNRDEALEKMSKSATTGEEISRARKSAYCSFLFGSIFAIFPKTLAAVLILSAEKSGTECAIYALGLLYCSNSTVNILIAMAYKPELRAQFCRLATCKLFKNAAVAPMENATRHDNNQSSKSKSTRPPTLHTNQTKYAAEMESDSEQNNVMERVQVGRQQILQIPNANFKRHQASDSDYETKF